MNGHYQNYDDSLFVFISVVVRDEFDSNRMRDFTHQQCDDEWNFVLLLSRLEVSASVIPLWWCPLDKVMICAYVAGMAKLLIPF